MATLCGWGGLLKHELADEDKHSSLETQRDIVELLKRIADAQQQLRAKVLSL